MHIVVKSTISQKNSLPFSQPPKLIAKFSLILCFGQILGFENVVVTVPTDKILSVKNERACRMGLDSFILKKIEIKISKRN